tara:strand:+ start:1696 stop:2748 length:1053 start_codon:yes stop_codon:yes gene_type:complete
MAYITTENINTINAELSNYCNAACPMCSRFDFDLNLRKDVANNSHTTLSLIKEKIGDKIIKNLKMFYSCGTYGDGSMNPEALQIFEYVRKTNGNCNVELYTNGGARTPEFWYELGKIGITVRWHIDGLEDTNHLYRRKVKWDKLMANAKAFVEGSRTNNKSSSVWNCFLFKHNQHQQEDIKKLAKQLGFAGTSFYETSRWDDFDYDGTFRSVNSIKVDDYNIEKPDKKDMRVDKETIDHIDKTEADYGNSDFATRKIECLSCTANHPDKKRANYEIYLMAKGWVTPCCWIGDPETHESQKLLGNKKTINLNHSTLDEIFESEFFKRLQGGIYGTTPEDRLMACYSCCGIK